MKLSAKIGCVELDADGVRVVVVKTGGARPTVLEAHSARAVYADESQRTEAVAQALREAVGAIKSKPSLFVLCESCQSAVARTITVPFRGHTRVAAAVPFELEPFLAFPIDELIVDFGAIREVDGKTEVLAVGVRRAMLEEHVAIADAAGVEIESINLDVAGLSTMWLSSRKSNSGLHAQVHLLGTGAIFSVTYNKALAYFRQLTFTPERFQEDPGAAAREVQNCIRAFLANWKSESPLEDLTVTGISPDPADRDAFCSVVQTPVVFEDLGESIKGANCLPESNVDAWLPCIGVSVSAAGGGVAFEFRKDELAAPGGRRGLILHAVFSAVLVLLVVAGYVGYCVVDYRKNMAEVKQIGDQIWDLYAKSFPNSESVKSGRAANDLGGIQTAELFRSEYEETSKAGSQISADMLSRPPLLDILKELSEKLPQDKVLVTEVKIRPSTGQKRMVSVSCELLDTQAFTQIFEGLKQSAILHVEDEPVRSQKLGKTLFTFTASL
ncbi:MAG: pilus assembly protein PilM [Candidatus Hydrogenedentes bacterium]|nr:pilus assembly protein PilM [Candidatus Hydrogenedentota bacterium]